MADDCLIKCAIALACDAATGGLWGLLTGLGKAVQLCEEGKETAGCCKMIVTLASGGVEDILCEAISDEDEDWTEECYGDC